MFRKRLYHYRVYGQHLCTNHPLSEAWPAPPAASPVEPVWIDFAGRPTEELHCRRLDASSWYVSPHCDEHDVPALQIWRDQRFYYLSYRNGNQFLIDHVGNHIQCQWPDGGDLSFVIAQLLGPVLGFVLQLRGVVALHASVLRVHGKGLAIVGAGGTGKSTLAATFHRNGDIVISDDVAALKSKNSRMWVQTGYPRLRLWPAAAAALYGSAHNLRRIAPNLEWWDKRYLELGDGAAACEELPLRAIYFLDWKSDAPRHYPVISALAGVAAIIQLDINSVMYELLDRERHARQLAMLASLLRCVSVRRLRQPDGLDTLPITREAILKDFGSLR